MKTKQLAFLACRILSLYFLVFALHYTSTVLFNLIHFFANRQTAGALQMLSPLVLYPLSMFIASKILWSSAERLSTRMTQGVEEEPSGVHLDHHELQIIACSVVGLVILTNALPDIFGDLPSLLMQNYSLSRAPMYKLQTTLWVAEKLVRITLGSYLLLGSRGFVRFITRLRTVGTERIEAD